jgi:stage V sporulation protein G
MQVTDVKLSLSDQAVVRAYVDITFDDCFVVRGLRIIQSSRGYLVVMPSKKLPNGRMVDIAHPISTEARRMIEEVVMAEYRKFVGSLLAQS